MKAASDVYCPVAGEALEVNAELEASPELANSDPYGAGWFFRMRPADAAPRAGRPDGCRRLRQRNRRLMRARALSSRDGKGFLLRPLAGPNRRN